MTFTAGRRPSVFSGVVVGLFLLTTTSVARFGCLAAFTTRIAFERQTHPKLPSSLHIAAGESSMSTPMWGGEHSHDARTAARLVSNAVELCQKYRQQATNSAFKTDGTPVTALDFAIQGYIISSLKKHQENHNDVSFVAEEEAQDLRDENDGLSAMALRLAQSLDPTLTMEMFLDALNTKSQARTNPKRHKTWILDPIDGTRGLLQGKQYCIGLALCIDGNVVVGVLGNPSASKQVMVAVRHHGLRYYNVHQDVFRDVSRNISNSWHTKDYEFSCLNDTTGSRSRQAGIDYPPFLLSMGPKRNSVKESRQPPTPFGPLSNPTELCCGSLVKYFAVASGQVAAFVQLSAEKKVNSWDHAPGMLCVQESGGSVLVVGATNKPRQLPQFDQPQFEIHKGIVCFAKEANATIRQQIVDSVLKH